MTDPRPSVAESKQPYQVACPWPPPVRHNACVRWGETIDRSVAGQVLLSIFMVVIVVVVALYNLPNGRPRTAVGHVVDPVAKSVGLEQNWGLFAPQPSQYGIVVFATVTYRGGRVKRITPPHNGLLVSPYRNYRWQKFGDALSADANSAMWPPAARYFARQAGGHVVKVVLTRQFRHVTLPGDPGPQAPRQFYNFYTLNLR